jgi:DNA-binding transcriptional MerR regulator
MTAGPRFADDKAPDALRTIGEVAEALGIRQHVLRYWEEQFPTLRPLKRSGGRRYYRQADIALLQRIDELVHRQGYTLRGARLALAEPDAATSPPLPSTGPGVPAVPETSFGMRARLVALRHTLASALQDA